jgi:SAM-dependent methyltransferase
MDYDLTEIAASYDRARDHGPTVLDQWMNAVAPHVDGVSIRIVLDLGCGTGRYSNGLARRFGARVIGVDPSRNMLEQARQKPADGYVCYVRGRAEEIPLAKGSVEMIFMSMIFHHFSDPECAATECRRVLRATGSAFLRAGTLERVPDYPQVTFFPSSRPLMEARLPTMRRIRETFEAAGFHQVAHELVTQQIASNHDVFAEKMSARADSVLASLSPEDFERGMAALRAHVARAGDQPVHEPIDLFVFR